MTRTVAIVCWAVCLALLIGDRADPASASPVLTGLTAGSTSVSSLLASSSAADGGIPGLEVASGQAAIVVPESASCRFFALMNEECYVEPPPTAQFTVMPQIEAGCGRTLVLGGVPALVRIEAHLGAAGWQSSDGPRLELKLWQLTGSFQVRVFTKSTSWLAIYDFRVRVRGCHFPSAAKAEPLLAHPDLVASSGSASVEALAVSTCTDRANCLFNGTVLAARRVPVLAVPCGGSYTLRLHGVPEATANSLSLLAPPGSTDGAIQIPVLANRNEVLDRVYAVAAPFFYMIRYRLRIHVKGCNAGNRTLEELPGFGQLIRPALEQRLRAATVRVLWRPQGDSGPWQQRCTGVRVRVESYTIVATAAHCVDLRPEPARQAAYAFFQSGFAVESSGVPFAVSRTNWTNLTPLPDASFKAYVGGSDWAYAFVHAAHSTGFNRVPALPYRITPLRAPAAGQQAYVYSLPASNHNQPVGMRGIYLGRMGQSGPPPADPSGTATPSSGPTVDLVGINPRSNRENSCTPGGSGSLAILADGTLLGPLSASLYDIKPPSGANAKSSGRPASEAIAVWMRDELHLDIDSDRFSGLCLFSTPTPDLIPQLLKQATQE